MNKDIVELTRKLDDARIRVQVGATYRHVKGNLYKVLDIVLRESTLEPEVLYCAQDQLDLKWTRPLDEFCDRFEIR